jgi:hypothetical protein
MSVRGAAKLTLGKKEPWFDEQARSADEEAISRNVT